MKIFQWDFNAIHFAYGIWKEHRAIKRREEKKKKWQKSQTEFMKNH